MALFTTQTGKKARAAWEQKYHRPLEERLWSKIRKGAANECWPWTAYKTSRGYGIIQMPGGARPAHRELWRFLHGGIPPKTEVCHKCDNPSCCNPSHLFLGTHKENMTDAIKKGRFVFSKPDPSKRGVDHHGHILTDAQVIKIRAAFSGGRKTIRGLANEFGVNYSTIGSVVSGRAWSHIPNPRQPNMRRLGERHPFARFTERDIRKMRSDYASGIKQTAIAKALGVSQGTIQRIVTGQAWKHVR